MHAWRDAPLHPELRITSTLGPPPRGDKAKRKGRKASGAPSSIEQYWLLPVPPLPMPPLPTPDADAL